LDRRTFKDFFTFIPFVIILLIPLSPIGHVLVFGAIQRFYPDFFPSCFTEQRQNLLQLYENAEYKEFTIDENWKVSLRLLALAQENGQTRCRPFDLHWHSSVGKNVANVGSCRLLWSQHITSIV
jgi:hypothetical protein